MDPSASTHAFVGVSRQEMTEKPVSNSSTVAAGGQVVDSEVPADQGSLDNQVQAVSKHAPS